LLSPGAQRAEEVHLKTNINPLWLAIPASCDFFGSTLMFIALTMVDASVYQMMRGIIVVITSILSMIFLKRKQHRHHWTGIGLIIAGVAIVGYVAIKFPDSPESNDDSDSESNGGSGDNAVFGIILLLLSQCFTGTMFIVEEKLLGDYYLDPAFVVGCEGMWGLCYYMVLLPVFQYIQCEGKLCNYHYFENSSYAFAQMGDNFGIIALSFGVIVSIACFNSFGIATTKYASAA